MCSLLILTLFPGGEADYVPSEGDDVCMYTCGEDSAFRLHRNSANYANLGNVACFEILYVQDIYFSDILPLTT